ncbi:NACHT domain-containing protein [Brevundimonas sp. UBA2416]|uniref:NACHT domain-containing protein n=1 Tax=Brevundimonas sp. UBA2416 TaxID=1946124 RepID=UPI0025BC610B|nr:NACHT domain-containing protein [Brevundimonas sp. UBA2416]
MRAGQLEQAHFEDEVRQIARLLWSEAALGGSQVLEGRERDGVFETRDAINVIEATVSSKRDKTSQDALKTATVVQNLRKSGGKFAAGWLVTLHEPTVDQKAVVAAYPGTLRLLSFEQFRSMLFNGAEYIRCRMSHAFGSVTDPETHKPKLDRSAYIPIELLVSESTDRLTAKQVSELIEKSPSRFNVVGDYGAGKSMTIREVFYRLAENYRNLKSYRVPVYLNLREHRGQTSPVEALERHSREIGYSGGASDLVRAWRGGHVDLFLDGFDEIATSGWGQSLKRVRQHRCAAMTLIRNFVQSSSNKSSIVVAGRSNFFDAKSEMRAALGVTAEWRTVSLNDFTPEQAQRLLKKLGYDDKIPEWLPSRPLLVAYFAFLGRQGDLYTSLAGLGAGAGWNKFLALISARESEQDDRLDPETVRQIIERLATRARATPDGMGRLSMEVVQEAYRDIVGGLPDEGGQQLLLRLPGLAPSSAEDGTRSFIDPQFASAARAGDVTRFVIEPFSFDTTVFADVQSALGSNGKDVLIDNRVSGAVTDGHLKAAFESLRVGNHPGQVAMDVLSAVLIDEDPTIFGRIEVEEAVEEELLVGSSDLRSITFRDCIISSIVMDGDFGDECLPNFKGCVIGTIEGLGRDGGLPQQFSDSDVSTAISGTTTNAEIMGLSLAEPVKVLLTILKKMFVQQGSGRQLSAFSRGLDPRAAKYVPEVLRIVQSEGLGAPTRIRGKEIWFPNRHHSARVRTLLAAPLLATDSLIKTASDL